MTNMQLYLTIGMPALMTLSNMVVMFFLFSRQMGRLDRLGARFDMTQSRLDRIEGCLDRIEFNLRQFYARMQNHSTH